MTNTPDIKKLDCALILALNKRIEYEYQLGLKDGLNIAKTIRGYLINSSDRKRADKVIASVKIINL